MKKKTTYIVLALIILIVPLFFVHSNEFKGINVDFYKTSSCGCCENYIPYLNKKGFNVNTIIKDDIFVIKKQYNISENMQSCHTAIINGYFVEGHVPIKAIEKLLKEKPNIEGIALPNMPEGSPGMSGTKKEEFIIYQIKDGVSSEFMRI